MSREYRPLTPERLVDLLAERIAAVPGIARVAIDGPDCADPHRLAGALAEPLRALGRPAPLIDARMFWRDASLRLEYGREDADAFGTWLDAGALRREVLDASVARRQVLLSLRDPRTNRATREPPVPVADNAVVLVSGALLLGLGLPFDLVVHLAVSPAARARRTPGEQAWTLPALERYDTEVDPGTLADVVVRYDDPLHPAVASRIG